MFKIPKQEFTPEFKELAVRRGKFGQSVGMVARELGLVEQTPRNWVKAADRGQLNPPGAKITTPERMGLSRLRAENAKLRMECEIPKKRRRRTSRKMCCEVRLDRRTTGHLPDAGAVRDAGREPQWISGLETRRHGEPKAVERSSVADIDSRHPWRTQGCIRQPSHGSGNPRARLSGKQGAH